MIRALSKLKGGIGAAAKAAAANLIGKRYPLTVTFIPTYRCNHECDYCDIWRLREGEMGTDEAVGMIDQFAAMGTRSFIFNGGEPLLRDDLGTLIGRCKRRGILTTVFSNGSLVARNLERIKDADALVISLDGPPDIHNRHRMECSYEDAVEGILAARGAGVNVWTNTVITKHNLEYLGQMVDEARGLGVGMMFEPVIHYPHSSNSYHISSLVSGHRAYSDTIRMLKTLKRRGAPILNSKEYLDYIMLPVWSLNRRRCWAGKLYCAVTPTGGVAPCYPAFISEKWPNGLEMGFKKAFREISFFGCGGCYSGHAETDFLYSFHMGAALNHFRSSALSKNKFSAATQKRGARKRRLKTVNRG